MKKTLQGIGRLFSSEGSTYICDAKYHVTITEDVDGRQIRTGSLSDIEYDTIMGLRGRGNLTLRIEDGETWRLAIGGLTGSPPNQEVTIYINSVIKT